MTAVSLVDINYQRWVDAGVGTDTYDAGGGGTNGGGSGGRLTRLHTRFVWVVGKGFLLDAGGEDTYDADGGATNGGVREYGVGFLLDAGGDDTYDAEGSRGTNGGSHLSVQHDPRGQQKNAGLLLDVTGTDFYSDGTVTCWDCSLLPKGFAGAQVDSDGTAPLPGRIDPRPTVDRLSVTEANAGHNPHAMFEVYWAVHDDTDDLATVEVTLWDRTDGEIEATRIEDVAGGFAENAVKLKAHMEENSGHLYAVELVVTDEAGNTASERTIEFEGDQTEHQNGENGAQGRSRP